MIICNIQIILFTQLTEETVVFFNVNPSTVLVAKHIFGMDSFFFLNIKQFIYTVFASLENNNNSKKWSGTIFIYFKNNKVDSFIGTSSNEKMFEILSGCFVYALGGSYAYDKLMYYISGQYTEDFLSGKTFEMAPHFEGNGYTFWWDDGKKVKR